MQSTDFLKGWREIAQYIGMDVSDTLRMANLDGLPYFRLGDTVYCHKPQLDAWAKSVSNGTGRFMKVRERLVKVNHEESNGQKLNSPRKDQQC